jgi:hypothetical protein
MGSREEESIEVEVMKYMHMHWILANTCTEHKHWTQDTDTPALSPVGIEPT